MCDCRDTLEGWLRGAKRLDAVGARLRAVGIRLSYHNHSLEKGFRPVLLVDLADLPKPTAQPPAEQ